MKIALVGPGLMAIPPNGWGAVESLIWKYSEGLKGLGHEVTIFNSRNLKEVVHSINVGDFDFIHVHYDEFAHYFVRHCKKPFCISSHYGYIVKRDSWSKGYFSIFTDFLNTPGIIALSPQIKQLYLDAGYKGKSYVLRNGVDISEFNFEPMGNGNILCLGKIEPRKRQAFLAKTLDGKIAIDFVGPITDPEFVPGETCCYKGVWTKEDVQRNLSKYSVLLLLSDGEAAPLVVIEALAAGLSVVISSSAAANLEKKEFITILNDDEENPEHIITALINAVKNNGQHRSSIRTYAKETFDFQAILKEYEDIIVDFRKTGQPTKNGITLYKQSHMVHYIFSRIWLLLSSISFLRELKQQR